MPSPGSFAIASKQLLGSTLLVLCLVTPATAELTNRWSFNAPGGSATAGTSIADSVGNATAAVVGIGATFDGASITLPGNTTGNQSPANISAYVDLPDGLISSKTNLTVEIWATPISVKSWQRLFDFGRVQSGNAVGLPTSARGMGASTGEIQPNATSAPTNASASDDFSLAIHRDSTDNTQRLLGMLDAGAQRGSDTGVTLAVGTQYHFVCTFTDGAGTYGSTGGQAAWYLNGTLVTTLDLDFKLSSIEDYNNWLGRAMYSGNSNSNIAYNEVRLYDTALTPAEISESLAAGPNQLPTVLLPVPDNLWTFTTQAQSATPSGTTFTDSIGGVVATLRGNGGSLSGGAVVLPGATTGNQPDSTISAYLDLPNGLVSQTASVTFEAWATPASSKNWQRLFDFGSCSATHGTGAAAGETLDNATAPGVTVPYDNLSLTLNNGADLNSQQLEGRYGGAAPVASVTAAATVAGTPYHYVLVVEDGAGTYGSSGCQVRWYRNGALQNTVSFQFRLNTIADVNNWIGRSLYSEVWNSNLSLNELRIYRRAITPPEIEASYAAGPDPSVGPLEPLGPAPIPTRRWDFNTASGSAASGTVFLDAAAGEIATVRGRGATLTGTSLVLPGTTNGSQTAANISAYLDLPNGIISSRPSLSCEAWITPLSSQYWQRIFDFGSTSITSGPGATKGEIVDTTTAPGAFTAYDDVMFSLNNGMALGAHRLEARFNYGAYVPSDIDYSTSTSVNTEYHYILTVQDGGGSSGSSGSLVKSYRNGVFAGQIDLPYRVADLSDVNNWIGRSMWAGDMNSHFSINELRLYDRAITAAEVASSFAAGPTATFAVPVAVADEVTIHSGQKALVDVLANDQGLPAAESLEIVSAPTVGSATVSGGKILYAHSGSSDSPVSFTYRARNVSGTFATGTVTVLFATSLRITNPALAMPAAPPENDWQLVDALPGLTFDQPLCIAQVPNSTKTMFVCERLAKVQRVADVTAASPQKNVFLNLQQVIAGRSPAETIEGDVNGERGLLGLTFHPQYETNGYFYVAYCVRIGGGSFYQRVSRFTVSSDPSVADPASEFVLLQQLDEGPNHCGGDLHFGPTDGYLYYTVGDEENAYDWRLNSQRINKDFFAGIFRIDVDKKPTSIEPNPHPSIPTDGGIARFSVPEDNPFVHTSLGGSWDGIYNGSAVSPLSGVRTEFWATGLRHTWRMSFDPATGDLWGGDVGQDKYEEVNKIVKGGNYGWVWREGEHDVEAANPGWPAKPDPFISIDPVYEYTHANFGGGDPNYKGNSVCGGYVYRGTRYPELVGSYIFSDSMAGHVWKMDTTTGETVRLTGLPGQYGVFSAQGVDPSNHDLLFCGFFTGKITRLTRGNSSVGNFPATLTATGLFSDLTDLSPAPGLLPVQVNLKFWSDYADKYRWFAMPDADSKMTWSKEGPWTYPVGMLWVKHFDLNLSRGNPATKKRIETRVLVKTDDGVYGVSYRWNDAGTEAYLVEDAGAEFDIAIDDHGTPHTQRWSIPSRTSCLTCHGDNPLSFNTRQLNRVENINGFTGNQLDLLATYGFLTNAPDPVSTLPFHVRPDQTDYPLEQRARAYLAVNCSYCHQTGGSVGGFWDGRAQLSLEQTGLINGAAVNNQSNPLNKYIVPGDTTHSIVLHRIGATNGFNRMPPLGTSEVSPADVQLITDWINQNASRPLYQQWRDGSFAAADPLGEKTADPDGDGVSNYDEYLRGSSPLSGANSWNASIVDSTLTFLRKANRYYSIQISDDLGQWQPWIIPELESSYKATDEQIQIPLPADPDGRQFFRFHVAEP